MPIPTPTSVFPTAIDQITNQPHPEIPDAIVAIEQSLLPGGTPPAGIVGVSGGTFTGNVASNSSLQPGNGTTPGPHIWGGSGAPATALGAIGDYYFRSDTPSTANQRLYVKTGASTWTGII
jgi:hypothetical protein